MVIVTIVATTAVGKRKTRARAVKGLIIII